MLRLPNSMRRAAALLPLIAVLAVLPAPAAATPPAQDDAGATLRIAMPQPDTLDPVTVSRIERPGLDLVENLFVGLTRFDPVTQTIEPMAAESWSVSDDGLTWTFELRDDVQWVRYDADRGEVVAVRPVVAGDFVYSIQRSCDPLRPSPSTANLMAIEGCQTVSRAFPEVVNDLFIAREIGVRATSPTTLEIDLLFPAGYFLTLTSTLDYRALPRESVTTAEDWTVAPSLLTSGPFAVQRQNTNGLTLIRNPYWPLDAAGNVETVEIAFTDDPVAARGSADYAYVSTDALDAAQTAAPDLLQTTPHAPVVMLGFSYDRAVVDQEAARRALSLAIDRDALVAQVFGESAAALNQFTPPGNVAQPTFDSLSFDPARARQEFATAGFEGCQNIPETLLVLVPDDDPIWVAVGQAVVDQWSANLGCSPQLFEVRQLSRTVMIELAHSSYDSEYVTRSHVWLATWTGPYPDGNAWVSDALHCRYGYVKPGRECTRADSLLDEAALAIEEDERADLLTQAEAGFFGASGSFPVAPLFVGMSGWLQQPWLTNVNAAGAARWDLWQIDTAAQPTR